jgi:hypothetical protein
MTEDEILTRAREAVASLWRHSHQLASVRNGEWDAGQLVTVAARALRDYHKPLSEIVPVDPDLVEARTLAVNSLRAAKYNELADKIERGFKDADIHVQLPLRAIKRGRELATQAPKS